MKNKKYRTISEVSTLLNINTHVIRYWDSKFPNLSLRLNSNKQRFFNNENIQRIKELKTTLSNEGKYNYPLDLANELLKKNNLKKNLQYQAKNKIFDTKKLLEVKKSLKKILNSI